MENKMELRFLSLSVNEGFARVCAAAFTAQADPTLDEVQDIKTAVSEAVTNAIVHAYSEKIGEIILRGSILGKCILLEIEDHGKGIENIEAAMQPFFTTMSGEERSGMGFTVMQSFMDKVEVTSEKNSGTIVRLYKMIGKDKS